MGVDVVRCRRNGLANAPFPLPILCPADGVEPVEPGRLPDLGYVEGCRDARQAALQLLPFVGPVLDSWAGQPISAPLEHSQLVLDLAGGHRHELTENMRSDPGARARELFPAKPGWPETTLVISHARRVAVNTAANRALQPPGAKLLVLETGVRNCSAREPIAEPAEPSAEHAGVAGAPADRGRWEDSQGRLCGRYRGGARARQAGQRAAAEAAGAAARHKAQPRRHRCQGLTLQGRVRLDLGSVHLSLRHLYVGASRATSSDLLEVA